MKYCHILQQNVVQQVCLVNDDDTRESCAAVYQAEVAISNAPAPIGSTYDPVTGTFTPPRPFPSWLLDEETRQWGPPVPYPDDDGRYVWNEDLLAWVAAPSPQIK